MERGIAEPQRPRHPFDKQLRQRHARHPFQHRAKHVERQRIIEAFPGADSNGACANSRRFCSSVSVDSSTPSSIPNWW